MYRFFVNKKTDQNYFELDEMLLKHIKVLRISNEKFYCNYLGTFYECVLENSKAKILRKTNINHEFRNSVILAAPIIKLKNFEIIIQKATELGVSEIIPMISKYSDVNLVKQIDKKIIRYQEIIKNAAEQSFRNIIPKLHLATKLETIIEKYAMKNKYIIYENATSSCVNTLESNAIILVGPEGGFDLQEVKLAEKNGFQTISLGKRILRSETACITSLSKIIE